MPELLSGSQHGQALLGYPQRSRRRVGCLAGRGGRAADGARPVDADAAAVSDGRRYRHRRRSAKVLLLRRELLRGCPLQLSTVQLTPFLRPAQYFLQRCKVMDLVSPRPSHTLPVKRPKNGWPNKKAVVGATGCSVPCTAEFRLTRLICLHVDSAQSSPHAPVRDAPE